jgi:hypothetical protein
MTCDSMATKSLSPRGSTVGDVVAARVRRVVPGGAVTVAVTVTVATSPV